MYKTVGIIGGMGPAATCDLMSKIISHTSSPDDQHHIHILVDSNTNIPDRTAAILHGGKDPVPEMTKSARALESIGAELLIMPCNTAHYFYEAVQKSVPIPVLHMPELTAKLLADEGVKRAGVLATDGTVQSGVYGKALEKFGVEPVYPDPEDQKVIMSLIYDYVKKGCTTKDTLPGGAVRRAAEHLRAKGAERLVLGCTELPIAFEALGLLENTADPTLVLAKAAIHAAGAGIVGE